MYKIGYTEWHQRLIRGIIRCKNGKRPYGRPKIMINSDFIEAYKVWKAGSITAVEAMHRVGMKPNTWYRRVKEYEGR